MTLALNTVTPSELAEAINSTGQLCPVSPDELAVLWAGEADVSDLRGEAGATLWLVRVTSCDGQYQPYVVALCASDDTAVSVTTGGWRDADGCPAVADGDALELTLLEDYAR